MSKTLKDLVVEYGRGEIRRRVVKLKDNEKAFGLLDVELQQVLTAVCSYDSSAVDFYWEVGWSKWAFTTILNGTVYRIKLDWYLPSNEDLGIEVVKAPEDPREYVYLSEATPAPREWFWGKAVWQTWQIYTDLSDLMYDIPNKGTDRRMTTAANVPHMKITGWKWCGFVYGELEPGGKPYNPYMEPVRRMNGGLEYADWSVWRKDGEA